MLVQREIDREWVTATVFSPDSLKPIQLTLVGSAHFAPSPSEEAAFFASCTFQKALTFVS